jgi:t-SNARE complex subunit (syntaxin)
LLEDSRDYEYQRLEQERIHHDALIAEREGSIVEIEKQMIDIHQMFVDISVMVNEQGQMIG